MKWRNFLLIVITVLIINACTYPGSFLKETAGIEKDVEEPTPTTSSVMKSPNEEEVNSVGGETQENEDGQE